MGKLHLIYPLDVPLLVLLRRVSLVLLQAQLVFLYVEMAIMLREKLVMMEIKLLVMDAQQHVLWNQVTNALTTQICISRIHVPQSVVMESNLELKLVMTQIL